MGPNLAAPQLNWRWRPTRGITVRCTADVLALAAMDFLRARGIYVPGG